MPTGRLLIHGPATPALADRPLADAPLEPDDVPDAAARRAGQTAQGLQRPVHASPGVELALVELRLPPGARHPQDGQRAERIEIGHDERGLEVFGPSCIASSIVPERSILPSVSTVR